MLSAIYIWVVLGGLDAFTGSYETLTGWLGFVPQGEYAAVILAVAGNLAWAAIYSTIQVLVYRRALRGWPAGAAVAAHEPVGGPDEWRQRGRFDPRAVAVAATLATVLLLSGTVVAAAGRRRASGSRWPGRSRAPTAARSRSAPASARCSPSPR